MLSDYGVRYPAETACVDRFFELMNDHENCFDRTCWAGHITGSAWVINRARTHVLLTHHRKLDLWVQLGGHSDSDEDTLGVATREAQEESGFAVRVLDAGIFDLDIHEIPARKADPAHYHFDVRFVFEPRSSEQLQGSTESLDLAWVPFGDLSAYTSEESMLRMVDKSIAGKLITV
jgi:8-oxo-dGTP pyrophosphatase MutT (NUDIX family)